MFKKMKEKFLKRWDKCSTAACVFHDKHCMKVWGIVLLGGVALVVGWVYWNR